MCGISETRLKLRLPTGKVVTRKFGEVKPVKINAKFLRQWGFVQDREDRWHREFGDYVLEASSEGEFFRLLLNGQYVRNVCWQGYYLHHLTHDMLACHILHSLPSFSLAEISYAMRR